MGERPADLSSFGALLRRYRLAAGLSQEALAERARLSIEGISALERGFRRTPQRGTLALLADALAINGDRRREFEEAAARRVLLGREGASVAVGPWRDVGASALPLTLTAFVGRETELEEIAGLLCNDRLVTLTGAGGIGKTRTALQVTRLLRVAEDTAYFVALAPVADPSLLATSMASALRVQEVPHRPLLETLLVNLKSRAVLLILDNCEHLITETARIVEALLVSCPQIRILATSREPLRVAGERRYNLSSLNTQDAVTLFRDRAREVDHRFALNEKSTPIVAELCKRLDGIPLAIELAAARVNALSTETLTKMLGDRFAILTGGARTALPRQRTLHATIEWSYDLLSPKEQRLFERLSVFAGGCTLAVAATVCAGDGVGEDEIVELLLALVDKSTVTVDAEGPELRYGLLESFREYALEKLAIRGEQLQWAHRHAYVFLNLAEELYLAWDVQPDNEWNEIVRLETENWRQALEFSLAQRSDVNLGQSLVAALVFAWAFVLGPVEGRRWSTLARGLVCEGTPPKIVAGLSHVELWIANIFDDYERELALSIDALEAYKSLDDDFGMVIAEAHQVRALVVLGRNEDVDDTVMAVLARARKLGLHKTLAYVLRVAGVASMDKGDLPKARARIEEADAIAKACGAERQLANARQERAECEFLAGDSELALKYASEALAYARAVGDATLVARGLLHLSLYLFSLARYDEAEHHARETLVITRSQCVEGLGRLALQRLAFIAAARPLSTPRQFSTHRARAATILGFLNCIPSSIGYSIDFKRESDRALDLLRGTMDGHVLEDLMSEGAELTEAQVIQLALS